MLHTIKGLRKRDNDNIERETFLLRKWNQCEMHVVQTKKNLSNGMNNLEMLKLRQFEHFMGIKRNITRIVRVGHASFCAELYF